MTGVLIESTASIILAAFAILGVARHFRIIFRGIDEAHDAARSVAVAALRAYVAQGHPLVDIRRPRRLATEDERRALKARVERAERRIAARERRYARGLEWTR